jgi:hypothetical protein
MSALMKVGPTLRISFIGLKDSRGIPTSYLGFNFQSIFTSSTVNKPDPNIFRILPINSHPHQSLTMRSSSSLRHSPPVILPAVRSDVPSIVNVWISTVRLDLLCQYQRQSVSEKKIIELWIKFLNQGFGDSGVACMKGVDADTEQITAAAVWLKKGCPLSELGSPKSSADGNMSRPRLLLGNYVLDEERSPINKYISEHYNEFVESWTKGVKNIELGVLITDSRFQRRGIGTVLLEWDDELADCDAAPCVLSATPFGHPLYQSLG